MMLVMGIPLLYMMCVARNVYFHVYFRLITRLPFRYTFFVCGALSDLQQQHQQCSSTGPKVLDLLCAFFNSRLSQSYLSTHLGRMKISLPLLPEADFYLRNMPKPPES
ncbi:hypothetical protein GGR50DRAFT_647566 [Xylaria sp. CBS 124048]|nr:hypothetical protein GGR50DRAFT_647566 [Xylaria sp. CBS 124048]